jgi:hypothetical protein
MEIIYLGAGWRLGYSVVGTFLTQNVTDTLSSQAFMTLAATFPRRQSISATLSVREATSQEQGFVAVALKIPSAEVSVNVHVSSAERSGMYQ